MTTSADVSARTAALVAAGEARSARNYAPLPVVIASGEGAWLTDVDGRRYLDCLSAYSAVNFGHGHPEVLAAARAQLERVTLVSRAFHHDRFAPFVTALADLCGKDAVLPMNTGAEAVESALKVARRWGYDVKGVAPDRANVVVAAGNFHGRTVTVVSFSDDPLARGGFGPFTPGFRTVPYGDATALEEAVDDDTVAVLLEPVQGEAGVVVPPPHYLPAVRQVCTRRRVLMLADEIQSGLGRAGATFACDVVGTERVVPDAYLLGKALGGGVVPVSAVVADRDVLGVLHPGEHGSTFGGNALACAVGEAVVGLLRRGHLQENSRVLGEHLHAGLRELLGQGLTAVRGLGLWAGVDVDPARGTGRDLALALLARGVLTKETHGRTLRLAPPLVVTREEVDHLLAQLRAALAELGR